MTYQKSIISAIAGRAIILNEDNIDTDRIIPARFLKCVTFDDLGAHVFEDDRAAWKKDGKTHPFDDPKNQGASILFTGANFGSGSSREHAVHALIKWGVRAIVAYGPYSEIFFGNALANGLPCVTVNRAEFNESVSVFVKNPRVDCALDLETMSLSADKQDLRFADRVIPFVFQQESARDAFISGTWDKLGTLLTSKDDADKVIEKLPYILEK